LELSDWSLQDAIQSACEDGEWEHGDTSNSSLFVEAVQQSSSLVVAAAECANESIKTINPSTNISPQQRHGILSPIVSAVMAGTTTTLLPNKSTSNTKSLPSKRNSIIPMTQDVTTTFNDDDSFVACEDETTTTSNNSDYIIDDIEEKDETNLVEHTIAQKSKITGRTTMKVHKLKDIPGSIATKSVHIQDMYKVKS
jgi:hypothetical protein